MSTMFGSTGLPPIKLVPRNPTTYMKWANEEFRGNLKIQKDFGFNEEDAVELALMYPTDFLDWVKKYG